ncbi:MAG: ornithine carbamoyltransferase [Clostridia bacterium]
MKSFLTLLDLDKSQILKLLDLADNLKDKQKKGIKHNYLEGKSLGLIFEKSSTRTRVSFEVGISQLGGTALYLPSKDMQIGRGEPIKDTARVLSRYLDGIMIRTFKQATVDELDEYGSIPIINGLTDFCHPCQAMADFQTIREYKGKFEGLKLAYIGDPNNMANSLIIGGLKLGMSVAIASPSNYNLDSKIVEFTNNYGDRFSKVTEPSEAVKNADVIYTDVWASMGQESEKAKRIKDFANYCVDTNLMTFANKDALVLHCLPAHRGEEITDEVLELHASEIFDEAENRLHAQKAIMLAFMNPDYKI